MALIGSHPRQQRQIRLQRPGSCRHLAISLPLLRPYITMVAVIPAIGATKVFEEVYLMTQGGPADSTRTIVFYLYDQAFSELEISDACTVGLALFLIVRLLRLIRYAFALEDPLQ